MSKLNEHKRVLETIINGNEHLYFDLFETQCLIYNDFVSVGNKLRCK